MKRIYEKPNAELIKFETEATMSDIGGGPGDISWGVEEDDEE